MQLKPITAIAVLLLVIASLLVSGCTTSTTSNTNQTPSATPSAATNNASLESYLTGLKNVSYADKGYTYKAWEVTSINSTSARLEDAFFNNSKNITVNEVATYTLFPTTQDATNYLNAMNKTAYSLASTDSKDAAGYPKVTGHAPQVYKLYLWNEGYNLQHGIVQFDNLVKIATIKQLN